MAKKLIMFSAMAFIAFRVIVTICFQFSIDFMEIEPFNFNYEILVLFLSIIALIFVGRNNIFGGTLYLIINTLYFGQYLTENLSTVFNSETGIELFVYYNIMISIVAISIAILIIIVQIMDKEKEFAPVDKKTEWFMGNDKYERQKDERADKNNYKTL